MRELSLEMRDAVAEIGDTADDIEIHCDESRANNAY